MNGFIVFSSLGRLEKLLEYDFNLRWLRAQRRKCLQRSLFNSGAAPGNFCARVALPANGKGGALIACLQIPRVKRKR